MRKIFTAARISILIASVMVITPVNKLLADECGKTVAKESIKELSQSVRLGDLTSMYGIACPTFGMARWYKLDNGNQVWFWPVKPSKKRIYNVSHEKYKLLMVTEVVEGRGDEQVVLWPPSLIGQEFKSILQVNWK